nr:hypothetical protein [Salinispora arenicola]
MVASTMPGTHTLAQVNKARRPWLGVLLGTPDAPTYEAPAAWQR